MWKLVILFIIGIISMSYLDIGFDEFMNRKESLSRELDVQQSEQFIQGILGEKIITEVAGDLIGQGINATNITTGEMSFDRAKGGTLKLGGYNNQNGEFALYDEDDIARILMNKDGLQIMDGSMIIKDSNGKTVIDGSGLVSESNFGKTGASVPNLSTEDFSSSSYTNVTNAVFNIITQRTVTILILAQVTTSMVQGGSGDFAGNGFVEINRNGVGLTRCWIADAVLSTSPILYIGQIPRGQHEIRLRARIDATVGTPHLRLQEWRFSYVILGT